MQGSMNLEYGRREIKFCRKKPRLVQTCSRWLTPSASKHPPAASSPGPASTPPLPTTLDFGDKGGDCPSPPPRTKSPTATPASMPSAATCSGGQPGDKSSRHGIDHDTPALSCKRPGLSIFSSGVEVAGQGRGGCGGLPDLWGERDAAGQERGQGSMEPSAARPGRGGGAGEAGKRRKTGRSSAGGVEQIRGPGKPGSAGAGTIQASTTEESKAGGKQDPVFGGIGVAPAAGRGFGSPERSLGGHDMQSTARTSPNRPCVPSPPQSVGQPGSAAVASGGKENLGVAERRRVPTPWKAPRPTFLSELHFQTLIDSI